MAKKGITARQFRKKLKEEKRHVSSPEDAGDNALNRIANATLLYNMMVKYPLPVTIDELMVDEEVAEQVINEAKKHCIVSFVTAIEVMCKEVILQFRHKWHSKGLVDLLNYQITLNDAFEIITDSNAERVEVVALEYNFQDLEEIQKVFNCLTNNQKKKKGVTKSFLDLISNTGVVSIREYTLATWEGKWKVEVKKLFALRHKIIHQDSESMDFTIVNIEYFETLATVFCLSIYCYCSENSFK
jgi:hypothetical protein